jgi:hypothetical protein
MRYARLLGLSLVALLAGCGLVELALAIRESRAEAERARVGSYYAWSFYTTDGTRIGPGTGPLQLVLKPYVLFGNRPDQATPQFTVDGMGFRDAGRRSNPGAPRVVVLGGSTAFGTGLGSDGETFAHQLGRLLGVEVINAAVIGYHSSEALVDLVMRLVDLRPSLIVTLDGWNDFRVRPYFVALEAHLERSYRFFDAGALVRIASIPSLLYPRSTRRLEDLLAAIRSPGRANPDDPLDVAVASAAYARNIAAMHRLGGAFGFDVLCLIQPQKPGLGPGYQAFRDRVVGRLAEAGVRYVDLNAAPHRDRLPAARFMDEVHVDGVGHRIMAEIAAEEIRRAGLLARPTGPGPR